MGTGPPQIPARTSWTPERLVKFSCLCVGTVASRRRRLLPEGLKQSSWSRWPGMRSPGCRGCIFAARSSCWVAGENKRACVSTLAECRAPATFIPSPREEQDLCRSFLLRLTSSLGGCRFSEAGWHLYSAPWVWLCLAGTGSVSNRLVYRYREMKSWECYPPRVSLKGNLSAA